MTYTALVRTFNSAATLPRTLASLAAQTRRPDAFVFVDSGSTDETLACIPADATVHRFTGKRFNYSEALNQGLDHVRSDYVLIISSHTALEHPNAIETALDVLRNSDRIGAAYFAGDNPSELNNELIDNTTFDGFNGIWNTASLVKCPLLRERPFRPEVFSAEDQEWSHWLIHEKKLCIARVNGAGLRNDNPRKHSRRKLINEYLAVALFVNTKLLAWSNILRIGVGAFKPTWRRTLRERVFKFHLFCRLVLCRYMSPNITSRYF